MSKFKAGDKVRLRDGESYGNLLTEGREFIVGHVDDQYIWFPDGPDGPWKASRFELVEDAPSNPSPVRKVTRTEIVPGDYDGVQVTDEAPLGLFIEYRKYADLTNLRAAARIFNEIADALEQNKEAS